LLVAERTLPDLVNVELQPPLLPGHIVDLGLDPHHFIREHGQPFLQTSDLSEFGERTTAVRQLGKGEIDRLEIEQAPLNGGSGIHRATVSPLAP
jgi:hypothetical protein